MLVENQRALAVENEPMGDGKIKNLLAQIVPSITHMDCDYILINAIS